MCYAHPTGGAYRYPAWVGHLLYQQYLRTRIVRCNCGHTTGETVTDDNYVENLIRKQYIFPCMVWSGSMPRVIALDRPDGHRSQLGMIARWTLEILPGCQRQTDQ